MVTLMVFMEIFGVAVTQNNKQSYFIFGFQAGFPSPCE